MKDIDSKDILLRRNRSLTALSVYIGGRWVFTYPTEVVKTKDQQDFFLISVPFGLVKQGTQDPKITTIKGAPGDYVARDQTGTYCLVTAEQFKQLFPAPNLNPPKSSNNSDQLKDPKFITNINKQSKT
jgi:hypothetical protein